VQTYASILAWDASRDDLTILCEPRGSDFLIPRLGGVAEEMEGAKEDSLRHPLSAHVAKSERASHDGH